MKHKITFLTVAVTLALLVGIAPRAFSQTYDSVHATGVVLAGNGTDTKHTLSITAATPAAGSFTLTFPGTEPGGVVGYVLTMNTTNGGLSWTNPASGLTVNLSGDVGGTSLATVIENTAGQDIVSAMNNIGTGPGKTLVNSMDADALKYDVTLQVTSNKLGLNLANPNTWTGAQNFSSTTATTPLTVTNTGTAGSDDISGDSWYVTNQGKASFSGGILTPSGGGLNNSGSNPTTNIDNSATGGTNNIGNSTSTTNVYGNTNLNSPASAPAANTNIDATSGTGGVVTIGNNGSAGSPGDSSTTYLAGAVSFTGTVTLPSGSVTAGSIGLTNQYMLVGNTSNDATPLAPSANSVLITNAASPIGTPQWSQTLPSGLTYPAAQITGAGNIGGSTVINTTGSIQTTGTLRTTGTTDISTTGTNPINIGDTSGAMNINIGNNSGPSVTTLAGTVNFTGTVSLPAGSVSASSLGLTQNYIFVGNSSNDAGAVAPTANEVLITGGGGSNLQPLWSNTLPSGLTYPAAQITGTGNIGGSTVINTTGTITGGALTSNGNVNLDASPNSGGTVNIGNAAGPSTTNIYGTVSFGTAPTFPAGSITNSELANSTIGLTSSGSLTITGSAIALGGSGTVNLNLGNANTWTATQTHNNTTSASAPLVASNTFAAASGNVFGATIGATGSSTGTTNNIALQLTASGSAGTNTALSVAAGVVDIVPFSSAGVVTNTAAGVLQSSTTLPSGLTIPSPTFTGTVTLPAGSISAASIGLAQNNIFVGNSSGDAAAYAPVANSVLITSGTGNLVPTWSTSLPSGLTIPAPTFTGSLTFPAGSISNASLANSTIGLTSSGSLTITGSAIALGGSGTVNLNLANANTWTATQTHNNTTSASAPLVASNTFAASSGNVFGATIGATGSSTGTTNNIALQLTASGSAGTNTALSVAAGVVDIVPFSTAGVVTNTAAGVLQSSTTLPSGLTIPSPTFTGTVTLPAGSISNASLANSTIGLTSSGSLTITGSAIALGGSGTVNLNLANANTWTGAQTFGEAALTSTTVTTPFATNPTADWAIGTVNSFFKISTTVAGDTLSGIANGVDGRVIILLNNGSTNNITIVNEDGNDGTAANRIHLAAGGTSSGAGTGGGLTLILAPDGFVTLIYDATINRWRVLSTK
jgi:filamentous hemagglutinin